MGSVLPGVPRSCLAGAMGNGVGPRMYPGDQGIGSGQLSWDVGHLPVLLTDLWTVLRPMEPAGVVGKGWPWGV